MELYGSLTTKEIKKTHSSRPVGRVKMGSGGREDSLQGSGWRTEQSHICVWINLEEQLGRETDRTTWGSTTGK